MGELIEHSDNGDGNVEVIRIGDAGSRVSLKAYQDITIKHVGWATKPNIQST